ncbi:MAG: RluA family pseudouridine synthase [Proteobacteria bacterium]|nr:RluA family pseudouridine synthase [Pseudomonadota bacterium]
MPGKSDTSKSLLLSPDPAGGTSHRACVAAEQAGERLDRFLAATLGELSRARLQGLLASGEVTRDGATIKDGNTRVKQGQTYHVRVPPPSPAEPQGQDIPLNVVYEDKDLIVIDKQAGLVVHPAAGNPDGTLVNALIAHCGASLKGIGGVARPGIVHRLDKDTSGLLVAAKNERAMASLAKQFANHTIERAYHAVVWGSPRLGQGMIEGQIGRNPFDRKRMAVLRGEQGKRARTRYSVIERFGDDKRPFASLIECRLETGRTHQIRVHLTHLGHPLIGDPSYGRARAAPRAKTEAEAEAYRTASQFPRQALHAFILGFQHPSTHKTVRFESSWPEDFSNLVKALRGLKIR